MNKKTIIVLVAGAVIVALYFVFTRPATSATVAGAAQPGSAGASLTSPGGITSLFGSLSNSITSLLNPNAANQQAAATATALSSLEASGTATGAPVADSSLAAALNAPVQQPIQQISTTTLTDEYGTPVAPPSTIGWDTDTSSTTLTTVPDTGSALDSPGLPGDVVSSD